jgi:hypothetical protein
MDPQLPPDPPSSRSRRVGSNSLTSNLTCQVVGLVSVDVEDSFDKRAAEGCAARRHGKRFDD